MGLKSVSLAFAVAISMAAAEDASDSSQLKFGFDGFKARMALEGGHLVNGQVQRAGSKARPIKLVPMNRNIVFLNQSASYGEQWDFDAGFMGVMWWPFTPELGPPATRTVRVEPRVSEIKAKRKFNDGATFVEFGYFPYKYNPDAWNLGEYLYRSGTYPGYITTTDGFQLVSTPVYYAYGAHLHHDHLDGMLSHELNFFTEPAIDPIGDITPAYEFSVNLPFLSVGAGAAYNRGLSYRPSQTRPKENANMYIHYAGAPGVPAYTGPYEGAPDTVLAFGAPFDTLHFWTHRGVKLMARAALDLGMLIPEDMRSPGDLRLFMEAAVLGWENQPYYYEKRAHRMPVMAGINLPTFRVLDLLSLQVEHYDNPFNDTYDHYLNVLPIWKVDDFATKDAQYYDRSPWRWSVHLRKKINRLATLRAQAASDHLRMKDLLTLPTQYEMTLKPKDWYYILRLDVGI